MARLISYPTISTVASGDLFPVTDISDVNKPLKNITAVNLQTFVNDGATLQRVVSTGNTYQASPSDVLWTWGTGQITATSTSFTSLLSGKRFKTTFIDDGSYTDVLPNQLIFNNASGNETSITPNTAVSSNIDLQWPSASGTLALVGEQSGSTSISPAVNQSYRIRVTNKTPGSPNFNDTRTTSLVVYDRQASSTLNWTEYSKQWTPSLDPGYDISQGLSLTDDVKVMYEESVKDIFTRLGYSTLNDPQLTMSYDNWMLASHQIDLAVRVNNAEANPAISPAVNQSYRIRVTNKTPGSPNFNDTRTTSLVVYDRQASSTLNWTEYSKQWTPSLDPGYDISQGLSLTDDVKVMYEESVKDIFTRLGYSTLNDPQLTMSYDNWMLASHQIDLAVRVNNAEANPGNGTSLIQLVDRDSPYTGPPNLPSTVCVWFVDTTDTSSNMAGPIPKIVFAGKDTAYAKIVNGGNQYSDGVTYTFTGNTGDTFRKYALLVEDEYYSNMRSTYLKVTGGRVVFQNLPTADPVSKGVVWDDAGILKISQG